MADSAKVARRSSDLAVVLSDDRITVVDLRAPDRPPLVLESTAMDVWLLLDGSQDGEQLVDLLAERYAASPEEIAAGVSSFLQNLEDLDLLEAGTEGGLHG